MPRVLFWPVPRKGLELEEILEGIISHFPPPKGDPDAPLRALIIDSWFDPYHGAVVMMRIFDGTIRKGTKIRMMSSGRVFEVTRVGINAPGPVEVGEMKAGEVGFLMAGIKEVKETRIGDTITADERPASEPLAGFKPMKPMVFSGLYPTDATEYQGLRDALEKLQLNDSSFTFEPETSQALGVRFPLRLFGSVTYGYRARTAGAGVRFKAHYYRRHGRLSRHHDDWTDPAY